MQHNSAFESGCFVDDLECSQIFKPSTALADFLEQTEKALTMDQPTSTPTSQSRNKEELQPSTTEFGIEIYQKTKSESSEYNRNNTPEKEFGDSDDEYGQERETNERNYGNSIRSHTTLDQSTSREKSSGFGDFFQINEDDLQSGGGGRFADFISDHDDRSNDSDIFNRGNTEHVSYKKNLNNIKIK